MSPHEKKKQQLNIEKAIKLFPKVVANQTKRYKARQKFLKETFGDLVKKVRKEVRRSEK